MCGERLTPRFKSGSEAMMTARRVFRDNRGVGTIEYALVTSLVSVGIVAAVQGTGNKVQDRFSEIDRAVSRAL